LPDMSTGGVSSVPVCGVATVRLLQRHGASALRGYHHQVNMVRHQAIADQKQGMELQGLPQQIQINRPLGIRCQDELTRVATLRDMVGNINSNYTS